MSKKDDLIQLADMLGEKCERDLTMMEFKSLVALYNKHKCEKIKYILTNQFPKRYIEYPVAYLKAILENSNNKSQITNAVNDIQSELGL
jgi:hypothetical protein